MIVIIVLIIIIFIIFKLILHDKGSEGEYRVSTIISFLDKSMYHVLNDVMVLIEDGQTFQIDHLVLSIYGIFVIETKNYKGWIFGNEKSEYWTQVIYKDRFRFYNPIKQNWSHVYALKKILRAYEAVNYYPIVVFAGDGELKGINASIPVIYDYELNRTIMDLSRNTCLSPQQVEEIKEILVRETAIHEKIKEEHINKVKNTVMVKEVKEANLICPRCNSELVLRNGKYGSFYGCSNYPNCKYSLKR